ncbi:Tetratricopeptide repeat (TPR)-like superfamily protein [Raphanus sativus]|nr:Tetratricopeptide repeat (TPR)-like superfamily protein [Raphanus sativus]
MEDVEEGIGFGIIRTSSYDGGFALSWALEEDTEMIEGNPGNGMFLSNYAKFLKEVRKDYLKAEEYCGRAILVNPNDGNVLAMYAELVWMIHKDSSRAESYFNRAVAAAPDDCYVQASYARFLWDAEEEEGGEEEKEERHEEERVPQASRMSFFTGLSPITAMS